MTPELRIVYRFGGLLLVSHEGFDRHSVKDASTGLACYQDVLLFAQFTEE